jgi:hypothetical protein
MVLDVRWIVRNGFLGIFPARIAPPGQNSVAV